MLVFILSCTIAIVVSFLCSMAEAVLLSLSPVRLETLKKQGKRHASAWLDLKKNVDRPIAAILILNTIAHTGGATVAGAAFDSIWGDKNIWIFSVLFTFVILFGTEIAPKVLGVSYKTLLAPILLKPLQVTITLLQPIIFFTDKFSRLFRQGGSSHGQTELEAADLVTLAQLAKSRLLIDHSQEQIIVNAAKLQTTRAADVMLPADEMVFFQIEKSLDENLDLARQSLHTRYPVSETADVDGVVGYVNFKEIFAIDPEEREETIHSYLRHTLIVRADEKLSNILRNLIAAKRHLAIVKSPEGKVIGMLTLEDVLEEIVGDIEDDLDAGATDLVSAGRGRWNVGGGVSLAGFAQSTGLTIEADGSPTLADLVEDRAGRLTKPGVQVTAGHARITVVKIRRGRVHLALVEPIG